MSEENQTGIDGLLCQLDAYREQLNEALNSNLNLRTSVFFLKRQNIKLTTQLEESNDKISQLTSC